MSILPTIIFEFVFWAIWAVTVSLACLDIVRGNH
jgi:hypothetical protein